jgi:signal transduction histidine kinase
MRQALRTRDERMQMMLSGIAHEVRNPLGGMELFAGLLSEELQALTSAAPTVRPTELPALQGYVQRIQKELRHLQAIVSDFLDYARRPRPQLGAIAIAELLAEVADSVRASTPAAVEIVVTVAAEPTLYVAGDATQLRRALHNLAHNAVQACAAVATTDPRLRTVELLAEPTASGGVLLRVRDSGPGIAADLLAKIWAPFFTTRAQGTGLGLAFVREIVDDHAGHIDLASGPTGTTFALTLPAWPGPLPAPTARSEPGPA